jgi:diguanylate cyclase (GGDEF)-like protein
VRPLDTERPFVPAFATLALAAAIAGISPGQPNPVPVPDAGAGAGAEARLAECWKLASDRPADALAYVASALGPVSAPAGGDDAAAIAELRLCRGYAHEQLGELDPAGAEYRRAVVEAERLDDEKLLASALVLRGQLAYYSGAFTSALEDLDRAYRLEVELGRDSQQRHALNAIANVYADARVGAYDRAIEYYRQLLAAHQARGDVRNQATTHFNLASTYERKGDLDAALAELEKSLALDRARNDPTEVAFDLRAAASVMVKLGRAAEALPGLDQAVARFTETRDLESLAQARLTRGIARRATGDLDLALSDLDAAAAHFRQAENDRFLEKVEEERAEALAAKGDFAAAYSARSAEAMLERRLAEVTRDEHTSRLRVQFDSDKKEAENRALARENELRGQALRDAERIRNLQRVVIALAAVLLVLLAALVVRQILHARRLRILAMTDELTRLSNRRAFFELAREKLAASQRSGIPLALLALDIDHFKRINDTHGHETGDRVLQRVANAARAAVRKGDAVGRTGGEEFLALLPDAGPDEAGEIAERLRAAVAAIDVSDLAPDLRVTVSVGLAARRPNETAIDALARRADEALYRAKERGRNRVERLEDRAPEPI